MIIDFYRQLLLNEEGPIFDSLVTSPLLVR